jgi:peptide/nickel transport system permease protein
VATILPPDSGDTDVLQRVPPETPAPAEAPRTPRGIAWARRRRALRALWTQYRRSAMGMWGLALMLLFVAVALAAPLLTSSAGLNAASAPGTPLQGPSWHYPLGTDLYGRSVLTLLIWGSRISLIVGLAASVVTMVIGTVVGIASGYYGGRMDVALNALTNWFLVIPWIPLAIVLASVLGPTLFNIILVIGLISWAGTARLVRAQALTVKERPYVERARALGSSHWHLITRHILPNVFPVIFANTILTVALSILYETTLSLLGLGAPNNVSWGLIIEEAFTNGAMTAGWWWWLVPPGVAIVLLVLAFVMCGYAFDEIINPKLRDR